MLSIKLHEATKQFKISNKLAMFFLEQMNIPVRSHSSVITMDQLEMLREFAADKEKHPEIRSEFNRIEKARKQRNKKGKDETDTTAAPATPAAPAAPKPGSPPKPAAPSPEAKSKPEPPVKPKPPAEPQAKTGPKEVPQPQVKPQPPAQPQKASRAQEPPKAKTEARPQRKQTIPAATQPKHTPKRKSQPSPAKPQQSKPQQQKSSQPKAAQPQKPGHPNAGGKKQSQQHHQRPEGNRHGSEKPRDDRNKSQHPQAKRSEQPAAHRHDRRDKPGANKFQPQKPQQKDKRDRPNFKGKGGNQQTRNQNSGQNRHHKGNRPSPPAVQVAKKPKVPRVLDLPELIQTSDFINIRELGEKLNVKLKDIEEKMRTLNPQKEYVTTQILDIEDINEICAAFGVEVDIVSYEDDIFMNDIEKYKGELTTRAPVVTVMGHVDHGKTTLLDTLRNTRVADREAGGITQTIGAYKLSANGHDAVFIDTPGHEAFTNIRARGAKVTDIVILVVAANDGVKPQTIEAINHALAAEVPIVVAINKIDLDGASPDRVKQELTQHNIVVEDWGGDVVSVEISAKLNQNLDTLLEMIHLVSEMQELKSYKSIPARGTIIESHLDPKLGPLASVLIQHGQLKRGDFFICGNSVGKVKSIFDDKRKVLKDAEVPMPVEIMGFEEVPEAGELFQVIDDIDKARKVIDSRIMKGKEANKGDSVMEQKLSLQSLFQRLEDDKTKVFPIIMKTDNFSSSEVLEKILLKHSQDKLKINIVHKGVGNVTESDILLASTSGSIIVGFNVKNPQKLIALAKRENVEVKLYNVIYHLIEDIDKAIKGEIEPEYVENQIGSVEVLQTFKISKIGIIAGCLVKEGKVTKKSKVKVLRKNDLVFEGELETLRRVKNDVSEVNAGTECGIKIKNFNAVEIGDLLEIYETMVKEVK